MITYCAKKLTCSHKLSSKVTTCTCNDYMCIIIIHDNRLAEIHFLKTKLGYFNISDDRSVSTKNVYNLGRNLHQVYIFQVIMMNM